MLFFVLLVAQQTIATPAAGHPGVGAPTVTIPRVEAEITIDGRLDEPVWSRAAVLTEFWQYEPVDGRPAAERTDVLVWYAPDAIHFGIRAYDRQPDAIRATVADRDNIDGDDHVTIYLDTFNDRRRAFFFAVNPLGVQQDGVRTEGSGGSPGRNFGGNTDESPDYWFESKGRLTDEGYVVELRIPFKSLRYPGDGPQRWGIQVERKVQRTGYVDTWTDARRASASFLAQAGAIDGLHDLERGIVLEAQPFVTASAAGTRDVVTGEFGRDPIDPEVGANVRLGFTNFSVDATVNPDFSQVEADAGQVTVNERFALFFPEKRPFFLTGIELFATPNQLVYTRRIVNPSVGGKVTGKVGGIAIAHLTAVDDYDELGRGDALFNVTRLRHDFAENSLAGVTFTDRSLLDGDDYNRVLAADVRHVFGGMYFIQGQLGGSWTRDATGDHSAPIWNVTVDRTGRSFGFNYALNGIGEAFQSDAGFVPRSGIIDGHIMNRFSLYGAPGALLEQFDVFFGPSRIWRYGDFGWNDAIEGSEFANMTFRLHGGWEIQSRIERSFYVLDPAEYAHYQVATDDALTLYQPLDEVSGPSFELSVNTPAYRLFDARLEAGIGREAIFPEGSEGDVASLGGQLSLRPNGSLRIALSTTYERITRTRDGSEFARTLIPRLKAEFQPTRALFFRAVAEYRSERQAALADARTGAALLLDGAPVPALEQDGLRVDLLASYEPTPGTVAFLGYGSSLTTDDAFEFSRLERTNDGFFIKLAYRFRR
ncbi:MAG TPA: DUF5916 domain-containing protein [Longimicrobiales bacterium]